MNSVSEKSRGPPSLHWYLQQVVEWARQPLFSSGSTPCTEATPALQHNNGVASHSTEFRLAEISSPVPARLSYQEVTACVQQPRPGPDGQRGLSWTLTLHAISNSTTSAWHVQAVPMCPCCTVLFVMEFNEVIICHITLTIRQTGRPFKFCHKRWPQIAPQSLFLVICL